MIPCVVYAAKSSPDEKDSTETQLETVRAAIEREGDREVVSDYSEQNVSAFKGERGPKLTAAMAAATAAATEHDEAELWVWHSSRVARGDGTKGRRSLLKVYSDLLYENVRLRSSDSVDDSMLTSPNGMLVGIVSEQNNRYSRDLSLWTKAGKDRQMQRGERLGGPPPDGLRRVVTVDDRGKPRTHYELDDERAPIIRRAFVLSEQGLGDPSVAGSLNREGFRTKAGKPWTRRRVQDLLTNPVYAGRVVRHRGTPQEQIAPASSLPALIDGERFDAVQAKRAARDRSAAGRKRASDGRPRGGRPTVRYALAKLGRCARCGGTMYARTSPYKRKDGTQARYYVCANSAANNPEAATCDAPKLDAETADAAILPHLRSVFVDFEGWLSRLTNAQASEREALERQAADARDRLAKLDRAAEPAHERYVSALAEGRETIANAALAALERLQQDREALAANLADLEAAAAELSDTTGPTDSLLDWWNSLAAALRGSLDAAETMAEVNSQLRGVFSEVQMDTLPNGLYKLTAVFSERGDYVWPVDQEYEPLWDEEPDFFPDTVDLYVGKRVPVETGRNTQKPDRIPFTVALPPLAA
jgi:DNA invertase Pin-like site-specific DNA recombinase